MIHLTNIDQALYSAPAPQTATVSDEAVEDAINAFWLENKDEESKMRAALTAAPTSKGGE